MGAIFIKCDDATLICDKTQYSEAGFWERIKLSIHLLTCKHCKVYTEQNAIVTKVLTQQSEEKREKGLTATEKNKIKRNVEDKL